MSKVVDLNGNTVSDETPAPAPVENKFQVQLRDDSYIIANGYIHVTPTFIAIVNKDDIMQVCVPSDQYKFVENLGPVTQAA